MTQAELINALSEKCGFSKAQVKEALTTLADLATDEVKKNGEFQIPGIGKLVKAVRAERKGRNPATGATITIPASSVVKFRVSKAMTDSIG